MSNQKSQQNKNNKPAATDKAAENQNEIDVSAASPGDAKAQEREDYMLQANAELKLSVAEAIEGMQGHDMTEASLVANPEKTARMMLELIRDYSKLQAKAKALAEERNTLLPMAARTVVAERRLISQSESLKGLWVPVPSLDNPDARLKCFAAPMIGGNGSGKGPVSVMWIGDDKMHVKNYDYGLLVSKDGIYELQVTSR